MLLDVIKDGELVDTHELSASKRVYKVGRQAGVADIVLTHGSISREHATITVSASGSVVVVDLGSAQGTKISGKPLVPNKPHLLPPGRSLTFARTFKRAAAAS
jgi:pSer/pThr/pTyr-binding forkhead associated (FHA) protein